MRSFLYGAMKIKRRQHINLSPWRAFNPKDEYFPPLQHLPYLTFTVVDLHNKKKLVHSTAHRGQIWQEQKMFYVVQLDSDIFKEKIVVPSIWLDKYDTLCLLPPITDVAEIETLAKAHSTPKHGWQLHSVSFIQSFDTYSRAKDNIAEGKPVMIKLEEEEEEQHYKEERGKRKRKLPLFLEQYSIESDDVEEGRGSIQDNSSMESNIALDPLIVKIETMGDSNASESQQQPQLNTAHDKSSCSVHSSLQNDSQLQVAGSSSSTVSRMNFAIVKFIAEDEYVAIISSNWITDDRNNCWYPNSPNVERLLKKRIKPTPHWKMYPIEIMKEYETFSEAREHLIKAENTSNSDSEPDQCLKIKTIVPVHFNFEELEECKISSYPSLDSFSNSTPSVSISSIIPSVSSLTSSVPSIFPSISSVSSITPSIPSISPSIPSISSSSHPIERSTASSQLSPASLYPIASRTSEMDSRVAMVIGQLQSTVADLVSEVRTMGRKLDRVLLNNPTGDDTGEREMALVGMLPMSTLEEFDKLEDFLKEADFHKLLVKVLITLGGRDCKTFIYNILRRLMTSQLATNFSFTGKPPKNREKDKKKAFCSTLLCRSIQVSVRKMYPETKDDFLKNHISLWLQQAKNRQDRREENKEKASSEQNGEL